MPREEHLWFGHLQEKVTERIRSEFFVSDHVRGRPQADGHAPEA